MEIIGIDPDTKESGIAILDKESRQLCLLNLAFPALVDFIQSKKGSAVKWIVEAGYLCKSNWHTQRWKSSDHAAKIGDKVGRCSEVGKLLVELLEHYGCDVKPCRPLRKCWRGAGGKITHDELLAECRLYRIGYDSKRSNQEQRDAALLAITF